MMFKLLLAIASLLSTAGFVIAAPIPAPAPQGLLDSLLGTGGDGSTDGPNGTSGSTSPLSSLLGGSASAGSTDGPNGTSGSTDPLSALLGGLA